jgi:hypothetical protein
MRALGQPALWPEARSSRSSAYKSVIDDGELNLPIRHVCAPSSEEYYHMHPAKYKELECSLTYEPMLLQLLGLAAAIRDRGYFSRRTLYY